MEVKTIFKRFIDIFKFDFLHNNLDEIGSGKTWKFWFLGNSIVAIVMSIVVGFGIIKGVNEFGNYLQANYPDAKISVTEGKLSTQGFQEPVYIESKDSSVFVMDTREAKFDESVLNNFEKGLFISSDKIYNKKSKVETQQINISQIKSNFSVSQGDIQQNKWIADIFLIPFMFIFIWIYFNVLRLVSALWWTIWFWILGIIMQVEGMSFSKTYFSVLNFYIIPLVTSLILVYLGVNIPFYTFLIFLMLFLGNYLRIKKEGKAQPQLDTDSNIKA